MAETTAGPDRLYEFLGGSSLDELMAEHGIHPLSEADYIDRYDSEDIAFTMEQVFEGVDKLAAAYMIQEKRLMDEQGEDYVRPAMVGMANGAIPVVALLGFRLARYGFDIDPFMVTTEGTKGDEFTKEAVVTEGLSAKDLKAINGRRVLVVDDMWHTGRSAQAVQSHIIEATSQGTISVESEDGTEEVEMIPLTEEDIQFVMFLTKEPEVTAAHVPPTLVAYESDPDGWTTGVGGNTFLPEKSGREISLGRYALVITTKHRPM